MILYQNFMLSKDLLHMKQFMNFSTAEILTNKAFKLNIIYLLSIFDPFVVEFFDRHDWQTWITCSENLLLHVVSGNNDGLQFWDR